MGSPPTASVGTEWSRLANHLGYCMIDDLKFEAYPQQKKTLFDSSGHFVVLSNMDGL